MAPKCTPEYVKDWHQDMKIYAVNAVDWDPLCLVAHVSLSDTDDDVTLRLQLQALIDGSELGDGNAKDQCNRFVSGGFDMPLFEFGLLPNLFQQAADMDAVAYWDHSEILLHVDKSFVVQVISGALLSFPLPIFSRKDVEGLSIPMSVTRFVLEGGEAWGSLSERREDLGGSEHMSEESGEESAGGESDAEDATSARKPTKRAKMSADDPEPAEGWTSEALGLTLMWQQPASLSAAQRWWNRINTDLKEPKDTQKRALPSSRRSTRSLSRTI